MGLTPFIMLALLYYGWTLLLRPDGGQLSHSIQSIFLLEYQLAGLR